jgi:crotonobetainyl-CoA:carnitine CoA-transferase CaiB-like acyl-CoA transferase
MADMALSGIKVLDLTHHVAGPFCTKTLADYGADVVKIERPNVGDPTRTLGPFQGDDPHPEKSGLFFYLNSNKRSITLNLKTPTGREMFLELVKGADAVVESFRPHVMRELGLSYADLKKSNPGLVMTSISSFGQSGPYAEYKATEMVIYGMGGAMVAAGQPDREPVSYGVPTAVYHGGRVAAVGTIGALYGAKVHGGGEHVDVSVMETLLNSVDRRISTLLSYEYSGEYNRGRESQSGGYCNGYFPCKDGYFCMAANGTIMFPRLLKMMGNPEELSDPVFLTPQGQTDPAMRDLFEAVLLGWATDYTRKEIVAMAEKNGLICGSVSTMEDVDTDPHFTARGVFAEIDHPVMGRVRSLGRPFIMSETPWAIRRPAPLLGQHNAEVYAELGYSREDLVKLHENGVI